MLNPSQPSKITDSRAYLGAGFAANAASAPIVGHTAQDDTFDLKTARVLLQRFLRLNEGRLLRTIGFLNSHQQTFLESLPLMLHVNHTLLPGYVTNNTPCGISRYEPTKNTIRAAKSMANAFAYTGRSSRPAAIHNISIMGSCGSIAHALGSDLDFWICHDPELSEVQLAELEQKLLGIQKWAEDLSLEVHFFLMNAEQFRQGQRRGVSGEDCGTSQHFLLLDEFYRTSIRLAGRYPLWWMVPADQEKNYQTYVDSLIKKCVIDADEYIDFGGIPTFPAGEFIGAGMWQLYKGIDSPYKSVIKIMLTELYASEYPQVEGLSLLFKKKIYGGESHLDALDPYFLLYKRLEAYLLERNELPRLELLRRCIYLKINEPMSRKNSRKENIWRREAIEKLIGNWQWTLEHLKFLDARKTWKVQQVMSERKLLVDELNFSYRFLSKFARENNFSASINEQDMNLLGRKLYAAFERKTGKLELINPNIAPNLMEDQLTIFREMADPHTNKKSTWSLHTGAVRPDQREFNPPIRRSRSVVYLLAWCYFNKILDQSTRFSLHPGETSLSENEIKQIILSLQAQFPQGVPDTEQQAFYDVARSKQLTYFVNVGTDPMRELNRRGMQLLTEQNDAFNYAGHHMNLVQNVDECALNTWHEITSAHYDAEEALMNFVLNFVRILLRMPFNVIPKIEVLCFCQSRPQAIVLRIKTLFKELIQCFLHSDTANNINYVLEVANVFYLLQVKNTQPSMSSFASVESLLQRLGNPQASFGRLVIDSFALKNHVLPLMAPYNQIDEVQVFYRKNGSGADFYVFDEKGAIFFFHEVFFQEKPCLRRWQRFIAQVNNRATLDNHALSSTVLNQSVERSVTVFPIVFYELVKRDQHHSIEARQVDDQVDQGRYHQVHALVEALGTSEYSYTIYCNHEEFSQHVHGDKLFMKVALYLMSQRQSAENYPLYITDIDLSGFDQRDAQLHTVFYLQQKTLLEQRLNAALRAANEPI
jgi:adenylate cyclase class 1